MPKSQNQDPIQGQNPAKKKRGIYRPKNELDGFLRAVFEGKYKWRRYELFREFLTDFYQDSGKVESVIETYQKHGIRITTIHGMKDAVENWQNKKNKERSKNALEARWGKKTEEKSKKPVDKGSKRKKT